MKIVIEYSKDELKACANLLVLSDKSFCKHVEEVNNVIEEHGEETVEITDDIKEEQKSKIVFVLIGLCKLFMQSQESTKQSQQAR